MPHRIRHRVPRRWLRAYAILAGALLVIAVGGGLLVEAEGRRDEREAEAAGLRLAAAGAQAAYHQVERTLEAVTTLQALSRIAWQTRIAYGQPAAAQVELQLAELTSAERFGVLQVAIIGPDGVLAWSTAPGYAPIDLSDREHFRVHLEGSDAPFVSEPLVGRASGRWSINISRAIRSQSGSLLGVAVVSVDPFALSARLSDIRFAEHDGVTLLRPDGTVVARGSDLPRFLGAVRHGPEQDRVRQHESGAATITSPLTGQRVFYGWRHVAGWPLIVSFAIPVEAAMEENLRTLTQMRLLLLAVLAVSGIGGVLVIVVLRRREAEEAAERTRAGQAEIASLLENLPGAAYRGLVEPSGNFVRLYFSSVVVRITGFPRERFARPGSYTTMLEDEARARRPAFYLRGVKEGHGSDEYRLRAADGNWIWIRDDIRLVRRLSDGRAEVIGLLTDITTERTLKAQALSAAKLATLGEMATGVAHELNQPCAAITLAADIAALEMDRGGAERLASARRRLDEIARQAARMRDIIDHFRIFGRTEEGTDGDTDLAEAVEGALAIAGGSLKAAGVVVGVDLPPGLPRVRGRRVPLEQVLVNLLVNARDAMEATEPGRKLIEITAADQPGRQAVELVLRDHGPGVPAALLDRVFEPFFTSKPVGKGTGLGLSIAYGTIRGFGGEIAIGNRPDGGAAVTISLPWAAPADEASPRRTADAPA
jgi:C4-dicarboxylate-specific signal transduction histidine kinase